MEIKRLLAAGAGQLGLGMAAVKVAGHVPIGPMAGPVAQFGMGYLLSRFGGAGLLKDAGSGAMVGGTAQLMLYAIAKAKAGSA